MNLRGAFHHHVDGGVRRLGPTLQSAEMERAVLKLAAHLHRRKQMLKVCVLHSLAGLAGVCRSQKLSVHVTCTLLNMAKPLTRCKKKHNWSHFVNDECVHTLTPEPQRQH